MDLISLPDEILLRIVKFSPTPNSFFFWCIACKRTNNLCKDEQLIVEMNNRFMTYVTDIESHLRINYIFKYPNSDLSYVEAYQQAQYPNDYAITEESDQRSRYILIRRCERNLLTTYSFYAGGRSLTGPVRTLTSKQIYWTNKPLSFYRYDPYYWECRFLNGKPHGEWNRYNYSYKLKAETTVHNDGKIISYYNKCEDVTIDFSDDLANLDYKWGLNHAVIIKDGILITWIRSKTEYHLDNNVSYSINLSKKNGKGKKKKKPKVMKQFKRWIEHCTFPIMLDKQTGKIVFKPYTSLIKDYESSMMLLNK